MTPRSSVATSSTTITTATTTRSSSYPRIGHTSIYNSAEQAEQCLSDYFPQFYYLLQMNPTALQRIRDSKVGFAVFAPSDAAIDSLGTEKLGLLEAACNDEDLLPIVELMVAFHVVSAPMTAEVMNKYNVVSTSVGELPVERSAEGMLNVNGANILQSYQFEDRTIQNYQDKDGNLLGSEVVEGGKKCIVHEVDGLVFPENLWNTLYMYYQSKNSEVGASE